MSIVSQCGHRTSRGGHTQGSAIAIHSQHTRVARLPQPWPLCVPHPHRRLLCCRPPSIQARFAPGSSRAPVWLFHTDRYVRFSLARSLCEISLLLNWLWRAVLLTLISTAFSLCGGQLIAFERPLVCLLLRFGVFVSL